MSLKWLFNSYIEHLLNDNMQNCINMIGKEYVHNGGLT